MKRGEDDLTGSSTQPIYVDPERPLTSIRKVEELFEQLDGDLRICDPYSASRTLYFGAQSTRAASIKLLT